MESFFDTKHLYRSYFKMALPVVLGLAVTLAIIWLIHFLLRRPTTPT